MRHNIDKVVSTLLFVPVLFASPSLLAQSGPPSSDPPTDPIRYETDYSLVVNDESPFVGGVFDREVGEAMEPIEVEWFSGWPEPISDDDGNTNQVVVLLDLDDGDLIRSIIGSSQAFESRGEAEEAVVDAVNAGIPEAIRFFSGTTLARHLIWLDRLDDETRTFFHVDDPEERFHQYIVLNYDDIPSAEVAVAQLRLKRGVRYVDTDKTLNLSWVPNDPYFAIDPASASFYQWGMRAMNFPYAWDKTRGHGYVGIIDTGLPSPIPADLFQNYRPHLSPLPVSTTSSTHKYHGAHVVGIVSATANNSVGVSGGCPGCSTTMVELTTTNVNFAEAIRRMYRNGMQVLNISAGAQIAGCAAYQGFGVTCTAINEANNRDVLIVAAAGNFNDTQPDYPAGHVHVLAVGGAQNTDPSSPLPFNWVRWFYGFDPVENEVVGSSYTGINGVMGPAVSIVSTVTPGSVYSVAPSIKEL